MAEVFLARQEGAHGFQKLVAIKRILPRHHADPQFFRMLIDEAKISVLMNHPNIAQVLEFGRSEKDLYLVLEYVPGHPLSALMKGLRAQNEGVGALEACYILTQVLDGLQSAHTQHDVNGQPARIIHRDVSPQNILLTYDGHVKLIDFGIAHARDRIEKTEIGSIKGKLRYLAPEMIDPIRFGEDNQFDHRIDVFAAGVVLFELIAGRNLFDGDDEFDVYDAITDKDLSELVPESLFDHELNQIIRKSLERSPAKRFESAKQFSDALRTYLYSRDPGFTQTRISEVMSLCYEDEQMALSRLNRQDGDIGDVPREIFLSASEEGTHTDEPLFSSSEKTVQHRPSAKERSNSELRNALPSVNPNAQTQVVGHRRVEEGEQTLEQKRGRQHEITEEVVKGGASGMNKDSDLSPSLNGLAAKEARISWKRISLAAVCFGLLIASAFTLLFESGDGFIGTHQSWTPNEKKSPASTAKSVKRPQTQVTLALSASPQHAIAEWLKDGARTLSLPTEIKVFPEETIELVFQAEHYESIREIMTIEDGETQSFHIDLKPLPVPFVFDIQPKDAIVRVDGTRVFSGDNVVPRQGMKIEASKQGYESLRETVDGKAGESIRYQAKLKKTSIRSKRENSDASSDVRKRQDKRGQKMGSLFVTSAPYWGRVQVNGRKLPETTPVRIKLKPGVHLVRVTHPPKGLVREKRVKIRGGEETRYAVQF